VLFFAGKIIRKRLNIFHESDSTAALYYACLQVFPRKPLALRTLSNGVNPGAVARIPSPIVCAGPALSTAYLWRAFTRATIPFLFLWIAASTFAQENQPPAIETKIAAGVEALKAGDLDSAERLFTEALEHGIKQPRVYHNLGVIAQMRGKHREAATRFRQALALQPDFGPARLLLGSSLLALHKDPEAVHELLRAVRLMPEQPEAHLQLARAYEASQNWLAAAVELQKLVELAPENAEYCYQLGTALAKLSGWSYQQISKRNPNSARLQQALGIEYATQEKYDLALAAYGRAARADPKMPELHLAMALILLELKRFDEAQKEIELELRLVPDSKAAAAAKVKIEVGMAPSSP
jgi:Tfp pilus assembly protein PilF